MDEARESEIGAVWRAEEHDMEELGLQDPRPGREEGDDQEEEDEGPLPEPRRDRR